MIRRPFEQVEEEFSIERVKNHPTLASWLGAIIETPLHNNFTRLLDLLNDSVETWNEDELKMMFIAPLLMETMVAVLFQVKRFIHHELGLVDCE
jgi:hypothetical protein